MDIWVGSSVQEFHGNIVMAVSNGSLECGAHLTVGQIDVGREIQEHQGHFQLSICGCSYQGLGTLHCLVLGYEFQRGRRRTGPYPGDVSVGGRTEFLLELYIRRTGGGTPTRYFFLEMNLRGTIRRRHVSW